MECEEFIQIIGDLAERIESGVLRLVLGKNIQDFEEIRKNIKSDASDVLKVPYVHFSAWYWISTYYLG